MLRYLSIALVVLVTSCYFFPFELNYLPGVNTKMAMSGLGLVIFGIQLAKQGGASLNKELAFLSLLAALVSFWGLASVILNNTNDYTYATYIVSMWVWLGGAYVTIKLMRLVHRQVSVRLVSNYLIAVCVMQCVLALLIDTYPVVKNWVDTWVAGHGFVSNQQMMEVERLYGIGATLDVAGLRFSAVLVMLAFISASLYRTIYKRYLWVYLLAFAVIGIVGNMIARTTIVGVGLAFVYWVYIFCSRDRQKNSENTLWRTLTVVMLVIIPVTIYCYQTLPDVRANIRFAFEGFFSLVEKGEWDVNSNNILKNMIVFPDNFSTWVIGDGYMENPYWSDPNYIGPKWPGYYKATDIGYLRFIFYFGLLGLVTFCLFFVKATQICMQKFRFQRILFLFLLAVNFIVWFKVSTDIFLAFALFLCVDEEENKSVEKRVLLG